MIKRIVVNISSTILILFSFGIIDAQEIKMTHKDSLNVVLEKYYELNLKVFQSRSNIDDIDNVFNLFTEDFTYVHPKFGGIYTRENLYNGYKLNQEKGSYNGRVVDIEIMNKIVGLNAIAVDKRFIKKENDKTLEGEINMTIFEFRKGRISKILEYW